MREIPLTQGKFALVDDVDYDWLTQWKWFADNKRGYFYAVRNSLSMDGKKYLIYMHREILGLKRRDNRQGDHINHATLDNRQSNLRICTHRQNQMNLRGQQNTTSRFKGVSWKKTAKKWESAMRINEKKKHLGYWNMEEVAALAYDMVAIREHGEFACLNFN